MTEDPNPTRAQDAGIPSGIPAEPRSPGQPGSLEPAPGEPPASIVPSGLDATLVFLRHGESDWVAEGRFQGQGNPSLSEIGRRQAALAGARLAEPHRPPALPVPLGPPVGIVHSPLARTAETAAIVAEALAAAGAFEVAVAAEPERGLLEIGQGDWEGLPGADIAERWADLLDGWRRDPLTAWAPGGESLPDVDGRVRAGLAGVLGRLAGSAPPGTVQRSHVLGYEERPSNEPWAILVGHDGAFKVALLALLDLPLARFWSFPFALCGITIVELRAGRARLRLHNATDHLAPLEDDLAREREAERARSGAL